MITDSMILISFLVLLSICVFKVASLFLGMRKNEESPVFTPTPSWVNAPPKAGELIGENIQGVWLHTLPPCYTSCLKEEMKKKELCVSSPMAEELYSEETQYKTVAIIKGRVRKWFDRDVYSYLTEGLRVEGASEYFNTPYDEAFLVPGGRIVAILSKEEWVPLRQEGLTWAEIAQKYT